MPTDTTTSAGAQQDSEAAANIMLYCKDILCRALPAGEMKPICSEKHLCMCLA